MTIPSVSRSESRLVRVGGWLFRQRTSLPLPVAAALLAIPSGGRPSAPLVTAGLALLAGSEALRIWGVHHIGAISRTRSDRLGPLVTSGPFGFVRNPLYLGNIGLWVGFAVCAGLAWLAPIVALLLGLEYHAIVRWEEGLLIDRRGDEYRAYMRAVPRWWPRSVSAGGANPSSGYSWRDTLFSERGTLIAIAVGLILISVKLRFW